MKKITRGNALFNDWLTRCGHPYRKAAKIIEDRAKKYDPDATTSHQTVGKFARGDSVPQRRPLCLAIQDIAGINDSDWLEEIEPGGEV